MFSTPTKKDLHDRHYNRDYELVYVSAPFSSYPGHSKEDNMARVREFCKSLRETDHNIIPIAPQIYLGQFMPDENEEDYDEALKVCVKIIEMCSKVLVFDDDGYISKGMKFELEYAASLGMTVIFMNPTVDRRSLYDIRV